MKLGARPILLAVAVLAAAVIVAASRLAGGGTSTGIATSAPASTAPSSTPAGSPSAAVPVPSHTRVSARPSRTPTADVHGDDGVVEDPPVMVTPTDRPDVREAATQFAAAWLNTYRVSADTWRARLLDRVTADLAGDLAYADPTSVPAGAKVGSPVTVTRQGSLLAAPVPVVTAGTAKPQRIGTLTLTLVDTSGQWLISEIDWVPAS